MHRMSFSTPLHQVWMAFWAGTAALASCGPVTRPEGASSIADVANQDFANRSVAAQYGDVLEFRSIFHTLATRQGYGDDEINRMLFLPTTEMLTPPAAALAATTPRATDAAIVQQAKNYSTSYVYDQARTTPFAADTDVDAIFAQNGPVTFIIIPGIFGEFIDTFPLHELFTGASSFKDSYTTRLATVRDHAFDLHALAEVPTTLGDRVHLGGLDDASGQPRVQAIFLQAKAGSTETLGDIKDVAAIFRRRINKIFREVPLDAARKIYFIGYSQGSNVAYEMITQAAAEPGANPFFENLQGVIAMAGVTYGSEVLDEAFENPTSANYKLLTQLQTTVDHLELSERGDNFITTRRKVLRNWQEILGAVKELASAPRTANVPGLVAEHLTAAAPDPMFMFEILKKTLTQLFKPTLSPRETLRNVERAQILIRRAIVGGRGLTTKSRLAWWRTHHFPEHLKLFSIAGSMPDMSTETILSPLLASPYYAAPTVDYQRFLRPGYYGLTAASGGVMLNDSQVIEHKERIWPALITHWNPEQKPFASHYMGILGTHHWGMAFPEVVKTTSGALNPFPRLMFSEALAAFVLTPKQ